MSSRGALNKQGTTSQLLRTGAGVVHGFVITSHTSGTIRLIDGLSAGAGRVIVNTVTIPAVTVGPLVWQFPEPAAFTTGLYVDINGTTIDYTVLWNEA